MKRPELDLSTLPRTPEGLLIRSELLAAGVTPEAITRALRSGHLRRLQRAVYTHSTLTVTPYVIAAAVLHTAYEPVATISHQTAARLHRMPLVRQPATEHVTIPFRARKPHRGLLTVHCHDLEEVDIQTVGGYTTTTVSRTAFDLLFDADELTALWACESAVRGGLVSLSDIQNRVEAAWSAPRVRRARRLAAALDPRSESPLETAARLVLLTGKLPRPRVQEPILDDAGQVVYRIDLAYPDWLLGIELDGRATHELPEAVLADRRRQNYLAARGWTILRFTWADVTGRPSYVVATVRDTLAQLKRAS